MADLTYGMTGKILNIDLTAQSATVSDSADYVQLSGGPALAYRILSQLLQPGLEDAFDIKNVLVFCTGSLTGTGVPGGCAATVAAYSPLTGLPTTAWLGGRFAAQLKYAGYDAAIITGAADRPVWINIQDNKVTLESASFLWGSGTRNTTAQICATAGGAAAVACIGPAGEHKAGLASIVSTGAFTADGLGGVMGSKNLKAIAVQGTGAVACADPAALLERIDALCKSHIGARGGYVVPSEQTYWNARSGLKWGVSDIETGDCPAGELSRMGLRTTAVVRDFGADAARYMIRSAACPSCPVGCMPALRLPALETLGLSPYIFADPDALLAAADLLPQPSTSDVESSGSSSPESSPEASGTSESSGAAAKLSPPAYDRLLVAAAGASLADDFGIGLADGQLARDFRYAVDSGALEKALTQAEYTSFDWEQYEMGNPAFLHDLFRRIALGDGEVAYLGDGSAVVADRWKFAADYAALGTPTLPGRRLHGAAEAALAVLSPDELRRPLVQLLDCGVDASVVEGLLGQAAQALGVSVNRSTDGVLLPSGDAGRIAAWSALVAMEIANLGLCPHLWPLTATPGGQSGLDQTAQLMSLVTGSGISPADLTREALVSLTLQRSLAALHLDVQELVQSHDLAPGWIAAEGSPIAASDLQTALTDLYQALGWDATSGLPSPAILTELELSLPGASL